MKLYGIWNKDEEVLQAYLQGKYMQFFGSKEEVESEIGWLNCETDGDVASYYAVAELDCETGIILIKEIFQEYNFNF